VAQPDRYRGEHVARYDRGQPGRGVINHGAIRGEGDGYRGEAVTQPGDGDIELNAGGMLPGRPFQWRAYSENNGNPSLIIRSRMKSRPEWFRLAQAAARPVILPSHL
jgi:hypothetical protein